jgi:hypothetical protein
MVFDGMLSSTRCPAITASGNANRGDATATTTEPGTPKPNIRIRASRRYWLTLLVLAGSLIFNAIMLQLQGRHIFALVSLYIGCMTVYGSLRLRRRGIDLTADFAILPVEHRRIPWQDVQAVVRHRRQGAWGVQLILEIGKPVNLQVPTMILNFGAAEYERDLNIIGQWWLAHRGGAWRPTHPKAPQPTPQL